MPYQRTNPVTVEEMYRDRHKGHHTICETLRELHDEIPDERLREKLRLVWAFGKKMHNKLKEYRNRYDDEMKSVKYEEEI